VGKNLMLLGGLMFLVGAFWSCGYALSKRLDYDYTWPGGLVFVGLLCWIVGKLEHWYHAE
jgi:hypothetical protein